MSLKEVRSKRDERKLIVMHPHESNKKDHVLLFSQVAEKSLAFKRKNALDDESRCGVVEIAQKCLASDILPELGELPFQEIRRFELVSVIRKIESLGVKDPQEKHAVI